MEKLSKWMILLYMKCVKINKQPNVWEIQKIIGDNGLQKKLPSNLS